MEFKKPVLYLILAVFCFLIFCFGIFSFCLIKSSSKSADYYSQGNDFYRKNDFQNAYYNFSKVSPISPIFLNSVYKKAKCADNLGDNKTALKNYKLIEKLTKDKYIAPFALWRAGQIYNSKKDFKEAKKTFLKLQKKYPETEYGTASSYMLSKYETSKEKKREYLFEYIKKSPKGKYAKDILLTILSDDFNLNDEQKLLLAHTLYENEAYNRALRVLEEIPIEKSWAYLIINLDKLNSAKEILITGNKGILGDCSLADEDIIENALSIYVKYTNKSELLAWKDIYNSSKDRKIKALALYKISFFEPDKKTQLYKDFSESKYAEKALFEMFLENLKKNQTALSLKYAQEYSKNYNNKEKTPVTLYFTALLSNSKDSVQKLLKEYPNSYYSYRAYTNILGRKIPRNIKIEKNPPVLDFYYTKDEKARTFFKTLINYGDFSFLDDFRINDLFLRSQIEYFKGNRPLSSVLARDYLKNSANNSKTALKLAYPVYFADEINYYAKKRGLSPYLILALMKEESHFNPEIISQKGAVGLMQIMPPTAEMLTGRDYLPKELTNVNLNIDLGTKYFKELMGIFSNNDALCVLAYNSGPNAVKKWLEDDIFFDIMVEKIPYPETKNYIKKVYTAYWNYLLTYGGLKIE